MNVWPHAKPVILALLVLSWTTAADAQLSKVGSPFVTPGGAPAYSRTTDTGFDGTHQVFLVAVSEHYTTPGGRVFASFASADGVALTSAFRLDSTGNFPFGPAVAYSPEADVFLVAWVNGAGQVRGRLVRYGTNALGSVDFALSGEKVAGGAWAPAVAYSPTSEEFLVAYSKGSTKVARVSTAGAVIGLPATVSSAVASGYHWTQDPAVSWNPTNNEFLLAYAQELSPGWQIRAHRISAGQAVGSHTVVQQAGSTKMPDVRFSAQSGKYLVTWFQSSPYGIYGRMLNADGSAVGTPQPMLPSNYGTYDANSLAYNGISGTFVVASLTPQLVSGTYRDTIGGAEVSSGGVPSTAMRFVEADSGNRFYPEIEASTTTGRFLTVFNKSHATFYGQVLASGGTGEPVPPPPPPAPAPLSVTSLTSDRTFPIAVGTSVTFTASATGGTAPYTYRFVTYNSSTGWSVTQDYSAFNTFTYYPNAGTNAVQVWVRNAGSSAEYDAWKGTDFFTVTSPTVAITAFTVNRGSPITPGSTTVWTATASGPSALEYQFWLWNGNTGVWNIVQAYGALNSFTWTPGASDVGPHYVQVWARTVGSAASYEDWKASPYFIVSTMTGALLSRSPGGTVSVGTPIVFTGTGQGGSGSYEYRFWRYTAGTGWTLAQDYGPYNTYTWYPIAGTHAVQVWVRQTGSTSVLEAYQSTGLFAVAP